MSSFWDRIYQTDNSFFGEEPSNFALSCYNEYMKKKSHVRKILELGCGQGRDTLFFASKGIDVTALDFSNIAIEGLLKHAKERNLLNNIYASIFDPRNKPIPFNNNEFDAVYSHMFFNMHFKWKQMKFMFQEIRRVLKHNGFNFFSVRNHNDKSFGKGKKIDNNYDVYDLNGFQIRFFTKQHVKTIVKGEGFEILDIKESYEEPVTLYLVSTRKTHC
jgi:SAM-dependent methyltransferase